MGNIYITVPRGGEQHALRNTVRVDLLLPLKPKGTNHFVGGSFLSAFAMFSRTPLPSRYVTTPVAVVSLTPSQSKPNAQQTQALDVHSSNASDGMVHTFTCLGERRRHAFAYKGILGTVLGQPAEGPYRHLLFHLAGSTALIAVTHLHTLHHPSAALVHFSHRQTSAFQG